MQLQRERRIETVAVSKAAQTLARQISSQLMCVIASSR